MKTSILICSYLFIVLCATAGGAQQVWETGRPLFAVGLYWLQQHQRDPVQARVFGLGILSKGVAYRGWFTPDERLFYCFKNVRRGGEDDPFFSPAGKELFSGVRGQSFITCRWPRH